MSSSLPMEEDRGLRHARLAQFLFWMLPVAIGFAALYFAAGVFLRSGSFVAAGADVSAFVVALIFARRLLRQGKQETAAEIVAAGLFLMCLIGAPLLPWLRAGLIVIPLAGVALVLPDVRGARLRRLLILAFVVEAVVISIATWMPPLFPPPPHWLRSVVVVAATTIAVGLTFLLLWQDANRLRRSIATADFHALKLQAIVERVPIVVFAIDRDAKFTLSEGYGLEALGLRPGEIVGRSVFTIYADLEWIQRAVNSALSGVEASASGIFGDRVLEIHLRPFDGGAIGVARDVTERARAEEGLRLLSEASRVLVDPAEAPGSALGRVARLAVDRFATECTIDLVDDAGELRPAASARRHVTDAEPRATISAALISSDGRPLGMLMVSSSERRFGPEDATLAEDLAARAAGAIEARRLFTAAQDAIRVRDEFLSVASHELKTPLTPLRLETTAIERAIHRGDLPRAHTKAAGLHRHVERLAKLVDELLDVGRIRAGRVSLERTQTDLSVVVEDAIKRLEPELERSGCRIEVDIRGDTQGEWDPSRLDQIATNLLSNAAKYGPNAPITVSLWADGDSVVLSVTDRGIGIAEADQTRIFRRFERAVSDRNYGGLGLGLFIVHELVTAHGGEVAVRSAPGEGATFVVTLPRVQRISRAS